MKAVKIKVLVVDDHAVLRQGLKALLQAQGDIEVVGEAEHGREALQKAKTLQPQVVLLDVAMPVMSGIEAAQYLAQNAPDSKVVVLSSYTEPQEVARALEAGVLGYVTKETAASQVAEAVRAAHKGRAWFSPQISKRLLQQSRKYTPAGTRQAAGLELSEREQQVMRAIANAKTNDQIADELRISVKTVEKHRGSLMHKLDIHEAATLTRFAVASGLVDVARPALANDFAQPAGDEQTGNSPTRAVARELRENLRKGAEENRKLRTEHTALRAKLDLIMAEGKEVKKKIPFRRSGSTLSRPRSDKTPLAGT